MNSNTFSVSTENLNFLFFILIMNIFVENNEDLRPEHILCLLIHFLPSSKSANHSEKALGVLVMQSFAENEMS